MPWVPVIGSRFRSTKLKYLVSNISRTSLWYSPIHAYFVNFHTILWSRDFYLHFRDKENATEKLSKLPHVPQLETGSQVVWFYFSSPSTISWETPEFTERLNGMTIYPISHVKTLLENERTMATSSAGSVLGKAGRRSPWSFPWIFPPREHVCKFPIILIIPSEISTFGSVYVSVILKIPR